MTISCHGYVTKIIMLKFVALSTQPFLFEPMLNYRHSVSNQVIQSIVYMEVLMVIIQLNYKHIS